MNTEEAVVGLFTSKYGKGPDNLELLPESGSSRKYYRLWLSGQTILGAWNPDLPENKAFLTFSERFKTAGLPVPGIIAVSPYGKSYLLEDLGNTTLYSWLTAHRNPGEPLPPDAVKLYKVSLEKLAEFQQLGFGEFDFSVCYPRSAFDKQSIAWDLNYFKYYFLKLAGVVFDEQSLENDFNKLTVLLLEADTRGFLYRDFQSRNIMIRDGEPWFIDFQGGRQGARQYDVASLLYDAKADIDEATRSLLLDHYISYIEFKYKVDPDFFLKYYPPYILIRILQALGAYGYRGYYEKKSHFLKSIPFALRNLRLLRSTGKLSLGLPTLEGLLDILSDPAGETGRKLNSIGESFHPATAKPEEAAHLGVHRKNNLCLSIYSFSYKKGIPNDPSGNGGGFIFDCRSLPNPGRETQYRNLSGRDQKVIEFLENEPTVKKFLALTLTLVENTLFEYHKRGFTHLMVSFGCTGGQHRSVYCAEYLANAIRAMENTDVELRHIMQEEWPHE